MFNLKYRFRRVQYQLTASTSHAPLALSSTFFPFYPVKPTVSTNTPPQQITRCRVYGRTVQVVPEPPGCRTDRDLCQNLGQREALVETDISHVWISCEAGGG